MTEPLSPERLATITASIGEAKPVRSDLLVELAKSVADRAGHDHTSQREDWYCMNLAAWAGERIGPAIRRLIDAEAEVARLSARVAELERPEVERQRAEVRSSFIELISTAEELRDYEGAATVQARLDECEAKWRAEDARAGER